MAQPVKPWPDTSVTLLGDAIQAARRGEAERERGRLAVELAGIAIAVSQYDRP